MNGWEYLALALELWTAIGLAGLTISLILRERRKLWQGAGSLVGVWVVYLAALAVVSQREPEQRVPQGRPACFHALCFTIEQVMEIQGFPARNHERLVQLTVAMTNRGDTEAQEDVGASLVDGRGHVWPISTGVSGNPLNGRVLARTAMVSQPVFHLEPDATSLKLLLTHGRWARWLRHTLVIGDPESLGHRPRSMMLNR